MKNKKKDSTSKDHSMLGDGKHHQRIHAAQRMCNANIAMNRKGRTKQTTYLWAATTLLRKWMRRMIHVQQKRTANIGMSGDRGTPPWNRAWSKPRLYNSTEFGKWHVQWEALL